MWYLWKMGFNNLQCERAEVCGVCVICFYCVGFVQDVAFAMTHLTRAHVWRNSLQILLYLLMMPTSNASLLTSTRTIKTICCRPTLNCLKCYLKKNSQRRPHTGQIVLKNTRAIRQTLEKIADRLFLLTWLKAQMVIHNKFMLTSILLKRKKLEIT